MPQIEQYLFRQLRAPTLWAILAFAAVALLSQSISGLDLIVKQRQSAWIFIEVTLLALPKMLSLIVPLGAFVAALITFNRLQTEQEIVVCYAGGISRWQVASPAMRWAVWLALITLAINLWVQPLASRNMRAEINAARADLAAALVREGQFTEPAAGLTVYAQTIDRGGLMHNLFIHQELSDGSSYTYTAAEGILVKRATGPELVMRRGATQSLSKNGELNYLAFDEAPFSLAPYQVLPPPDTKAEDRFISELLHPSPKDTWGSNHRDLMLAEFHSRIAGPLYNLTFMAFAISAVLGGGFSRMGYARRMAWVSALAIATRIIGFVAVDAAGDAPILNILQYATPIAGIGFTLWPFVAGGRSGARNRSAAMAARGA